MSIKRLKSRGSPPWGAQLTGVLSPFSTINARPVNFVVRFFTAGTTTEVGKVIVPSTFDDVHVADDTTNVVAATNTVAIHVASDTTNVVASADANSLATLYTLLNEIKADYNAHRVSTTFHSNADGTNVVASADATTEATAVTLANEIKADYNAHRTQATIHPNNDDTNIVTTADSTEAINCVTLANEIKADYNAHRTGNVTTQASVNTLLNELKTDYNAHIASTTFHSVADGTNTITSADATDAASSQTLANEIKTDFNAHRSQATVHPYNDQTNEVTSANASTLATTITLANEIKADYNAHRIANDQYFNVYGIAPGTYDIGVKADMCASMKAASVVLTAGTTTVANLGIFYTGDVSGNEAIALQDVTITLNSVGQLGQYNTAPGNWSVPEMTTFGEWTVVSTARRRTY